MRLRPARSACFRSRSFWPQHFRMRLQKSCDPVETVLHGLDGESRVHRVVSPGIPETFGNNERPQIGAVQFGHELAACEGIPRELDVRALPFKLNSAPSIGIRCPVRNPESLVHEERKTLVDSGMELWNFAFGRHVST